MSEPPNFISNPMGLRDPIKTREEQIAEAAYFRAKKRGFAPGQELDDWLAAEAELRAKQDQGQLGER